MVSFYQAAWWRSECAIRPELLGWRRIHKSAGPVSCLVPQGELHPYDPFDFYYPSTGSVKGCRSLPYEFADVSPEEPSQIKAFCVRFGVPGPFPDIDWEVWDAEGRPRDYRKKFLNVKVPLEKHFPIQQELTPLSRRIDSSLVRMMSLSSLQCELYKFKNFLILAETLKEDRAPAKWILEADNSRLLRGWYKPIPKDTTHFYQLADEMFADGCHYVRPRLVWAPQSAIGRSHLGNPGSKGPPGFSWTVFVARAGQLVIRREGRQAIGRVCPWLCMALS